jgi:PIN domain nuclease of toxin-antitoxin system
LSDDAVVLDASAVLAFLQDEPGAAAVEASLPHSVISAVNLSEVIAKLSERGMPAEAIREALEGLPFDVHAFGLDDAYKAGALRAATRAAGLSFGDRACLALAARLGVAAVTADRAWIKPNGVSVPVRVVR